MINNDDPRKIFIQARLLFTVKKNDFTKVNKNYATNTDLKIIIFNCQNNKVKRSDIQTNM